MAKKGRKPRHYITTTGKVIQGLTKSSDDRFRPVGVAGVSFGKDEATAIFKFLQWKHEQDPGTLEPLDSIADGLSGHERARLYFRNLIITDPKRAAIELDCQPLELLADVEALKNLEVTPSLPLAEIVELYSAKNFRDPNERKRSEQYWAEFCQAVKPAVTVDQVTEDRLQAYADAIGRKKLQPKTIRNRCRKIAGMIKYAHDRRKKHRAELAELKADFNLICKSPKNGKPIPQPIDPDDFQALLDVANTKWQAMLLLMLNCALHPGELADVEKSDIDLKKRQLWNRRSKTNVPRVARLWQRTVDAIKAYQEASPHESNYVFVSRAGGKYLTGSMNEYFAKYIRSKARLADTVKLDCMRDGARTAASEGGASFEHMKMLMGHSLGVDDHYTDRTPSKTQDVVDAIEQHYFPDE